jgi:Vacuolar protein sorting-associated protein 62
VSADPDALLRHHLPHLKYDSHEIYFADSAAEWTDYTANRLMRGDTEIAAATPAAGVPRLSLDFLGPIYPDDVEADKNDVIGDAEGDYAKASHFLHQQGAYRNRVYGHFVPVGEERWLQYWFFYFYNDFNLVGGILGAGRHEGDWEMIQLRLGEDDRPDYAVYAQHKKAGVRRWNEVELVPGTERPVVYVARGSHASYFDLGPLGIGMHGTGNWVDWADGERPSPEPKLEIVREDQDRWKWVHWPGHWGDTKKKFFHLPFDDDSPIGPGPHSQWSSPGGLAHLEVEPEPVPEADIPTLAKAEVIRRDDGLAIDYAVEAGEGRGIRALVVTVNSRDDPAPPVAHTIDAEAPTGVARLAMPIDPAKAYDVAVSAAFEDRSPTASLRSDLPAVA